MSCSDRLASLVSRSTALAASAPGAKTERSSLRLREAGFLEECRVGPALLAAVRADEPHQALRQDRIQGGDEAEQIDVHVHEAADHVEYVFACTVVKTRCPVSADCTAMLAVSGSRISPTMILSGSCRRMERQPAREG